MRFRTEVSRFAFCVSRFLIIGILILLAGCASGPEMPAFDTEGAQIHQRVLDSEVPWETIGKSVEGRDIYQYVTGDGEKNVLIIGGFHGAEIRGAELALEFAGYLHVEKPDLSGVRMVVVPVLNPDGLVRQTRVNANSVDINRNFPTENWTTEARGPRYNPGQTPASEPETRLAMHLVESLSPACIVSIHAPLEVVNFDGPARALAERMAKHTGYPVSGDIGYPTPGSFGNYAGVEKQIPTITLELPRGPFAPMWLPNREALMEVVGC